MNGERDFLFVVMTDGNEQLRTLLLSAEQTAGLLGIGRTLLYAMHSNGKLGPLPVKLGARVLWQRAEVEKWVSCGCPNRGKWQLIRQDSRQVLEGVL